MPIIETPRWICPWTELVLNPKTKQPQYSLERNVAELEFDWETQSIEVCILGIEKDNQEEQDPVVLLHQMWTLSELLTTETITKTSMVLEAEFDLVQQQNRDLMKRIGSASITEEFLEGYNLCLESFLWQWFCWS
jgi:hypothetical protein